MVIGCSYGATVAADLALCYPDRVRALVLLEGDAPRELAPAVAEWVDGLTKRLLDVAAQAGVDAVAKALITEVAGENAWLAFPAEIRQLLEQNGPAILAELQGEWWLNADATALTTIHQPVLLVAAADSPAEFRQPVNALAAALPNARTALVAGGHPIGPAAPEVLSFVDEILTSNPSDDASDSPPRRGHARRTRLWPAARGARDDVHAVAKDRERYANSTPPPAGYTLQHEIDGILRTAESAGFDRFHLVG